MTNRLTSSPSNIPPLPRIETPRGSDVEAGDQQLTATASTVNRSAPRKIPLLKVPSLSSPTLPLPGRVTQQSPIGSSSPSYLPSGSPPPAFSPSFNALALSPRTKLPPPLPPYPSTPPTFSPRGTGSPRSDSSSDDESPRLPPPRPPSLSPRGTDEMPKLPPPPLPISPSGNTGPRPSLASVQIPPLIILQNIPPYRSADRDTEEREDPAERPSPLRKSKTGGPEELSRGQGKASSEERNWPLSARRRKRSASADEQQPVRAYHSSRINPGFDCRKKLPALGKLFSNEFDVEKAEIELSQCIQSYPAQKEEIVSFLKTKLDNVNKRKTRSPRHNADEDRYYKFMALVLIRPGNKDFILSYLDETDTECKKFAQMTIGKLREEEKYFSTVLEAIKCFTREDLTVQNRETLFREPCLSSSMCCEFAHIVWEKELKDLREEISKQLKGKIPELCLNPAEIEKGLKKKNPKSDPSEEEIQKQLNSNRKHFEGFAKDILSYIFPPDASTHFMKVPSAIQIMLTTRRALITDFLNKHSSSDDEIAVSRSRTGEILCLRTLNPFIISIATDSDAHSLLHSVISTLTIVNPFSSSGGADRDMHKVLRGVLISLTKVIQSIANEVPPEDEKAEDEKEPVYDSLYNSCIDNYRDYIDKYSLQAPKS